MGNMKPDMYNINFPHTEPNFTVQKQKGKEKRVKNYGIIIFWNYLEMEKNIFE